MATFAAALVGALLRGRAGAPVRLLRLALDRRLAVGGAQPRARRLPSPRSRCCPSASLSTDEWLGARARGRAARCAWASRSRCWRWRARSGCCGCASGPALGARDPEEGPTLGAASRSDRALRAPGRERAGAGRVHLGGLPRLPRRSSPAIATLAGDPRVAVGGLRRGRRGRGLARAARSRAARSRSRSILDGAVLAKGTFNNLAQLESVLATGRAPPRRARLAEAVGG